MAILTQHKTLNVIPGINPQLTVHCSQGDVGSVVDFELYAGSTPFTPEDAAISVQGIRKDGTGFGPTACLYEENVVSVTIDEAMTSVPGPVVVELTITEESGAVSTANFAILVEAAAFPNGPLVDNSVDVYQQILAYVQSFPAGAAADATAKVAAEAALRQAADQVLQNAIDAEATARANAVSAEASARTAADTQLQTEITGLQNAVGGPNVALTAADFTDTSKIYVVAGTIEGMTTGDWYYWSGTQWVSGGVYNSTAVQTDPTLSVAGMAADAAACGDVKTAMLANAGQTEAALVSGLYHTNGTSIDIAAIEADANYVCTAVACSYGDVFYFSGKSTSSNVRPWAFLSSADGENNIISLGDAGTYKNEKITAPFGAAYIIINSTAAVHPSLVVGDYLSVAVDEVSGKLDANVGDGNCENWSSGYYSLGNSVVSLDITDITENASYVCQAIPCQPGDVFYYSGKSTSSGARPWAFLSSANSTNNIIAKSETGTFDAYRIVAPPEAAYLVVNSTLAQNPTVIKGDYIVRQLDGLRTNLSGQKLLKKRKASVSFVFDDGKPEDTQIKAIFDFYGIKCGFAVYSPVDTRYIDYHAAGYEILAHASAMPSPVTEAAVKTMLFDAYNAVFTAVGECPGWVTPSSALADEYKPLVYDYYEYGFTIYKGGQATPSVACMDKNLTSYGLWRSSLQTLTLAECEAIVDYAKQNNLLVCFYGHAEKLDSGEDNLTTANLKALIEYIKAAGVEIETPYKSIQGYMAFRHNEDYLAL